MSNPLKIQEVYGLELDDDYDDEDIRIHLSYLKERKAFRGDDEQSEAFSPTSCLS